MTEKTSGDGPEKVAGLEAGVGADGSAAAPAAEATPAAETPAPEGPSPPRGRPVEHGAYAQTLHASKDALRAVFDTHRKRAEREARDILRASGMLQNPLAKLITRQVARLEALVLRFEVYHGGRGHFQKDGNMRPSVQAQVDLISKLLVQARQLLEALLNHGAAVTVPGDVVYRASFFDGDPIPNVGGTRPAGPSLGTPEPRKWQDEVPPELRHLLPPADSAVVEDDALGADVAVDEGEEPVPVEVAPEPAAQPGASGSNGDGLRSQVPEKRGGPQPGRAERVSTPAPERREQTRAERLGWQRWPEW